MGGLSFRSRGETSSSSQVARGSLGLPCALPWNRVPFLTRFTPGGLGGPPLAIQTGPGWALIPASCVARSHPQSLTVTPRLLVDGQGGVETTSLRGPLMLRRGWESMFRALQPLVAASAGRSRPPEPSPRLGGRWLLRAFVARGRALCRGQSCPGAEAHAPTSCCTESLEIGRVGVGLSSAFEKLRWNSCDIKLTPLKCGVQ